MNFGSLTSAQQILVRLYLRGGPQYQAEMIKAGLATKQLAVGNRQLQMALAGTTRRTWLQNQALFTARRALFYTTLGIVAAGAAVIRLGFAYDSAMQQARVALEQVITPQSRLTKELAELYRIAALTPFNYQEVTTAFRQMYISLKPFGISIDTVNKSITAITDNLSATGRVSPAALNRVSVALTHMANVGYLSGQALNQLGRDGIQIQNALRKELGLTGDQLKDIGSLRLDPGTVLNAIISYTESTKGLKNAAIRQSNLTLLGAWSTFKDIVSQASGGGQAGAFKGVQGVLAGVNLQLAKFYKSGRPVTLETIAKAFDKQLSPSSHIVLNLFIAINTAFRAFIVTIGIAIKALGILIYILNILLTPFGSNHKAAKILGYALGILAGLWVLNKVVAGTFALTMDALKVALIPVRWIIRLLSIDLEVLALRFLYARDAVVKFFVALRVGLISTMAFLFTTPVGWVILAVALVAIAVVLYFRWKKFHDVVNSIAKWFYKMGTWAKIFFITMGPIGWTIALTIELVKHWRFFYDIIMNVVDALKKVWHWFGKIGGFFGSIFHHVVGAVTGVVHGGNTSSGPLTFDQAVRRKQSIQAPRTSAVAGFTPNNVTPINQSVFQQTPQQDQVIQVVMDRKVVAQAVARANQDHAARR